VSTPLRDRPARKPFVKQSYADILRSMLLIAVLVATAYACGQLMSSDPEPRVRTIDYSDDLAAARDLAPYTVLSPRGLSDGWRATSVDLEETDEEVTWHLGYLTPSEAYVGLEQTDGEFAPAVGKLLEDLRPTRSVDVAGQRWQVHEGDGRDAALVRTGTGVTTVVVGSAGIEELTTFAAALG
jgi:hypothetical protein